jgi:hypothetical protein
MRFTGSPLDGNPHDLIEADLVAPATAVDPGGDTV